MGKRWKYGPVKMLQPWSCDHCNAGGLLECMSPDDCVVTSRRTARLHATTSPQCDREFGANGIRFKDWYQADPIKKKNRRSTQTATGGFDPKTERSN